LVLTALELLLLLILLLLTSDCVVLIVCLILLVLVAETHELVRIAVRVVVTWANGRCGVLERRGHLL